MKTIFNFNKEISVRTIYFAVILILLLSACGAQPQTPGGGLPVVATTSILGDVVAEVGGEHIALTVLMPPGTDPHAFEATPRDLAALDAAALVFANGLGLEESIASLLHDVEERGVLVSASAGAATIEFGEHEHEGEDQEHEHEDADPHVWMDPRNVIVWVDNIAAALAAADPQHAAQYRANAQAYTAELEELDAWIEGELATLPTNQRQLVTDHEALNYFAARYGFEIIGALVPGYSTLSEPSAGELAELERAIKQYDVPAIFVGASVNPALAQRVAADTGVMLVPLYAESLSEPGGPAPTYLEMMRYNAASILDALVQ